MPNAFISIFLDFITFWMEFFFGYEVFCVEPYMLMPYASAVSKPKILTWASVPFYDLTMTFIPMSWSMLTCVSQHPKILEYYETLQKHAGFIFLQSEVFTDLEWYLHVFREQEYESWMNPTLALTLTAPWFWTRHFMFLHQFLFL